MPFQTIRHTLSSNRAFVRGSLQSTLCCRAKISQYYIRITVQRHETYLLAQIPQEDIGLIGVKLVARRELHTQLLLQRLNHVIPLPRPLKLQQILLPTLPLRMICQRRLAVRQVLHHTLDQTLRQIHDIVHIRIRHIELADREFRVMRHVDTLIPKDTTDFVYTVQSTDDELLEIELGGDTKVEVEIKVVVMRDERLSSRSARNHARYRRLNLQETKVIEVTADIVDNARTSDEDTTGFFGEDEVEVALAVAGLDVLETEVARGKLVKVGSEQNHFGGGDGEFTLLGTRGGAHDTDDVTSTEDTVRLDIGVRVFRIPSR